MKAWIAKDKEPTIGENLFLYIGGKPIKMSHVWNIGYADVSYPISDSDLPAGINPKWEDDEPVEVELTIKKIER